MEWIAISGSWRNVTPEIEKEVRQNIREIMGNSDKGILSGGALGVDWIATDEAIKLNPKMNRIKIFLPTSLKIYKKYYSKKAEDGTIMNLQAKKLISQLRQIQETNSSSLIEGDNNEVNQRTYFNRIVKIINLADKLVAFRINKSKGATYTIKKAEEKGIPIEVLDYDVNIKK